MHRACNSELSRSYTHKRTNKKEATQMNTQKKLMQICAVCVSMWMRKGDKAKKLWMQVKYNNKEATQQKMGLNGDTFHYMFFVLILPTLLFVQLI